VSGEKKRKERWGLGATPWAGRGRLSLFKGGGGGGGYVVDFYSARSVSRRKRSSQAKKVAPAWWVRGQTAREGERLGVRPGRGKKKIYFPHVTLGPKNSRAVVQQKTGDFSGLKCGTKGRGAAGENHGGQLFGNGQRKVRGALLQQLMFCPRRWLPGTIVLATNPVALQRQLWGGEPPPGGGGKPPPPRLGKNKMGNTNPVLYGFSVDLCRGTVWPYVLPWGKTEKKKTKENQKKKTKPGG